MKKKNVKLIYVFDAYCAWCFGFANTIREVHKQNQGIPLEVISGGLFIGDDIKPMAEIEDLKPTIEKIAEDTGAKFGSQYKEVLREGTFIMNSDDAAVGFAALRSAKPEKALDFAHAMEEAFFVDGMSLSREKTYQKIAADFKLDSMWIVEKLKENNINKAAHKDFKEAEDLGIDVFPTLLLEKDGKIFTLGEEDMSVEALNAQIQEIINSK